MKGDTLVKALEYESNAVADPKGQYIHPSNISNVSMSEGTDGRAESRGGLDFDQLLAMSNVPIISALVQTRINQLAEFSVPEREGINIGFQIRLKDRSVVPTAEDRTRINELYDFILKCGDPRLGLGQSFEAFLRMLAFDSLVYDQACFEIIKDAKGNVAGFHVVDATTIRRCKTSEKEKKQGYRDPDSIFYVQIVDDKIVAEYKWDELCFGVRRPRSALESRGYGNPELAQCVGLITNLLNTEAYNAANFTSGVNVNGILAVKTRMNPALFRQFRKEFYAMLSGSGNSRKTPLIQLSPDDNEGLQAVNLGSSNREMEFQAWHAHLMKAICALFQIDPFEIGYKFGSEGEGATLNESSGITRLGMSKDKGLRPFVRNVESWLNTYIMQQLDDRFEINLTGLDSVSPREQLDRDRLKVSTYMTLNELRSSFDLPPVESGDVILNEFYLTAVKMKNDGIVVSAPITADFNIKTPDKDGKESRKDEWKEDEDQQDKEEESDKKVKNAQNRTDSELDADATKVV
jgi:hypothetical protein